MKKLFATMVALIGTTALAIVPGEWNSDFSTSLSYAEKYNIPLVVVWGNTSCAHCQTLEDVLDGDIVMSWASKHSVLLVNKCESIDSQEADDLAAKEWIKSLANVTYYPFVGVYWKTNGTVVCSTAFTGRLGVVNK